MSRYKIDNEDAATLVGYVISMLTVVGIVSVDFMTYSFSDTLFTLGEEGTIGVTIAGAVAVILLAMAYVTNDNSIDDLDDNYTYAVAGSAIITFGMVFFPRVQDFLVGQHDVVSVLAVAVATAGYAALSYYA